MHSGHVLRTAIWVLGGLLIVLVGFAVVDESGPTQETQGTVVSTRFTEGATTNTAVQIGEIAVPIHSEIPDCWIVELYAPLLGRTEVAVSYDKFRPGQRVFVTYRVGRLTGSSNVLALRDPNDLLKQGK
jgi:hypothetical protein